MLSQELWNGLDASATAAAGAAAIRLCPDSGFNLFAAVDANSGHRILLLKSVEAEARAHRPLPAGRGFRVHYTFSPGDPEGAHCLRFILSDRQHADVFDVIGNDVIAKVLLATGAREAFGLFVSRIQSWQAFLDSLPGNALGLAARQGLFAELWFLREILLSDVAASLAVSSWAGPAAQAKDFQFTGFAIEVKSSSAKQHVKFRVASEIQLDESTVGRLLLCGILLERLAVGGLSLPTLVESLRNRLASEPCASRDFAAKLVQVGYFDADADEYRDGFAVRSYGFFDVAGDFPRITGSGLRQGVGEVSYTILQAECLNYAVDEGDVRLLLRTARL